MIGAVTAAYRAAFSGLPRAVWWVAIVTLVNRSGTMVLPFLALYLTSVRGFTATQAGALVGLYGLGAMGGAYLGGRLCDRLDPWRVMALSLALAGCGFLVLGALRGPWAIGVTLVLLSLAAEAFRPASGAALTQASAPGERARAFALSRQAINLGMSVGPAVGGFLALRGYGWLFAIDGATSLAAALVLRLAARPPAATAPAGGIPSRGPSPLRDGLFLVFLVLMALVAAVFFQLLSTYPLTLRDLYGFSEAVVGVTLAVNALLIAIVEMVLVHRLQRRDPLRLVALGSLIIGAGFAMVPFGRGIPYAVATVVVWTIGEMLVMAPAAAHVAERAGAASGAYMGAFQLAFAVAFVVAPLAGTWVYETWGATALWVGCGIVGAALWTGFDLLAAGERVLRSRP
jgi:predicted MFS family arabinose efflux permease